MNVYPARSFSAPSPDQKVKGDKEFWTRRKENIAALNPSLRFSAALENLETREREFFELRSKVKVSRGRDGPRPVSFSFDLPVLEVRDRAGKAGLILSGEAIDETARNVRLVESCELIIKEYEGFQGLAADLDNAYEAALEIRDRQITGLERINETLRSQNGDLSTLAEIRRPSFFDNIAIFGLGVAVGVIGGVVAGVVAANQ